MNTPGFHKNVRVLVLDDEESIRDSLMEFLEDCGFSTFAAGSAEAALDRDDLHSMDVIIVDIRLPRMDGPSFIKVAHAREPHLQFLIHTGSMDFQLDDDLRAIGLSDHEILLKPVIDMTDFIQSIGAKIRTSSDADQENPV